MDEATDTKWSLVLAFNSILYLSQAFFTLCMLGVLLWAPLGFIGFWGHFFGGCAPLAAIVVTGVFRFSDQGRLCSDTSIDVKVGYNSDGDSFNF